LTGLVGLAEDVLPPSGHDKHVVHRDDVDLLDTLGLELVVSLNVGGDLVRTRGREAVK